MPFGGTGPAEKSSSRAGFELIRTKGSHKTYSCREKNLVTTIPFHPGNIPAGTLRAIIKQSGMSVAEFLGWLRKRKGKQKF